MKKFVLLFVFALTVFAAQAQKGSAVKLPLAVGDTIVNTGVVTKTIKYTGGYTGTSIQVVLSKLSGTGAGTLIIQGSDDGVNYKAIGSAYTITDTATQSQVFYVTAPLPTYIQARATGSGTESVVMSVWYNNPVHQTN